MKQSLCCSAELIQIWNGTDWDGYMCSSCHREIKDYKMIEDDHLDNCSAIDLSTASLIKPFFIKSI